MKSRLGKTSLRALSLFPLSGEIEWQDAVDRVSRVIDPAKGLRNYEMRTNWTSKTEKNEEEEEGTRQSQSRASPLDAPLGMGVRERAIVQGQRQLARDRLNAFVGHGYLFRKDEPKEGRGKPLKWISLTEKGKAALDKLDIKPVPQPEAWQFEEVTNAYRKAADAFLEHLKSKEAQQHSPGCPRNSNALPYHLDWPCTCGLEAAQELLNQAKELDSKWLG